MDNFELEEGTQPPEKNKTYSPAMNSVESLRTERWKNLNSEIEKSIKKKLSEDELKVIVDVHDGTEFDPTIYQTCEITILCWKIST